MADEDEKWMNDGSGSGSGNGMGGKGKAAEEKRGLESASAKLSFLLEKEKELQKISGS